ncbi:Alpha-ketoglutarate-dependent dioxygenase alkB 7, mitochondrial [Dissophora globulifera]|uniref:Alpha-ketoglutarate-dependent dioxygenase alkB 7, mitochondrial n=1 Tax=Dissophora globulifera TaxID=979702 RepID=A0A9P6RTE7_9FUNG|nr:Alpha-ketoglutarate-dependent dioxygenase alkB 7, mitochondrial [Dissophora globulifera]
MTGRYRAGVALLTRAGRAMRVDHVGTSPCFASGMSTAGARSFRAVVVPALSNFQVSSALGAGLPRHCYSTAAATSATKATIPNNTNDSPSIADPAAAVYNSLSTPTSIASSHFDLSKIAPAEHAQILHDFIIVPDYLTVAEQSMLVDAATKKLKRALGKQVRYEDGHFDGVITRYRECSATDWGSGSGIGSGSGSGSGLESAGSSGTGTATTSAADAPSPERTTPQEIMQSIKREFFPHHWNWVAPHILELEAGKGGIKPHVDHLDASGQVVAGLCLGSTAVMELIHEDDPAKSFRVLLPKGCFYFQRDSVRYRYKHGIPILPEDHQFRGSIIPKEKRISIMLRNALEQPGQRGRVGSSSVY